MAIDVDVSGLDTIEEIDKAFKKAIAKADDAEEGELRLAHANARAHFFERQSSQASLAVAKRDALDKYPLAKDFAEDLTGNSPDEIMSKAKRIHERLEQMVGTKTDAAKEREAADLAAREAAQRAYAAPAAGGAGSPPGPAKDDAEAVKDRVLKRLQRGEGLQDSQGKLDLSRFLAVRIAEGADAAIHNPSYRSFNRPGSAEDKRINDDRTKRKAQAGNSL